MKVSDRINKRLHGLMVRYVMHQYAKKSRFVEKKHPELFLPVAGDLSRRHKELWGRLGLPCNDRWLRLHVNLTGIQDHTFCPEDIFFARIERILNDCENSGRGPEEKNELWRYLPEGLEPEVVVRFVRGNFFNKDSRWISRESAQKLIDSCEEPLVGKPCRSSGGNGVVLFLRNQSVHENDGNCLTTDWIERQDESYVVQKKIEQDAFSSSFNASSINTLRMMTLRCPWDGKIVVCRSMMRMGVSDAVVDNMMKGGLCVCVGNNGQFGKYAYDYDGARFEKHPVSGVRFSGLTYPNYEAAVKLAEEIHAQIPFYNLLSFDFVGKKGGGMCVIEINATSEGITQLQYDYGGLFGEYSDKIVDWCVNHVKYDTFKHLRTFY